MKPDFKLASVQIVEVPDYYVRMAISSNASFMAFTADEKTFEIHRLSDNSFSKLVTVAEKSVTEILFAEDEALILTLNSLGEFKIWDSQTGSLLRRLEQQLKKFTALAFSHDGQYIFTAQDIGLVEVWNTINNKRERIFQLESAYRDTEFYDSLDKMVISKSGDTAFLYFCESKIAILDFLKQTVKSFNDFVDHGIGGMAFDNVSGRLYLCGWDGYVSSFQPITDRTAASESILRVSGSSLTHLSVSALGNLLLVSDSSSIYIIDALSGDRTIIYETDKWGDILEICSSNDLGKILIRETTDDGKRTLKLLKVAD